MYIDDYKKGEEIVSTILNLNHISRTREITSISQLKHFLFDYFYLYRKTFNNFANHFVQEVDTGTTFKKYDVKIFPYYVDDEMCLSFETSNSGNSKDSFYGVFLIKKCLGSDFYFYDINNYYRVLFNPVTNNKNYIKTSMDYRARAIFSSILSENVSIINKCFEVMEKYYEFRDALGIKINDNNSSDWNLNSKKSYPIKSLDYPFNGLKCTIDIESNGIVSDTISFSDIRDEYFMAVRSDGAPSLKVILDDKKEEIYNRYPVYLHSMPKSIKRLYQNAFDSKNGKNTNLQYIRK